ncbi:AraC family transcriptional regulator [Phenylobacterium deserti]|uniref:AraC family transcriptional regulator n=1 Tax=Phenylobacterium deserti TaxID=1914756 RepID=A0A328A9R8_9CAUL|nr:helix-turn-helix transcriptional regulator [Phenylobacterium deserti]RAK51370.1 AraC family transcriptional regulator [Phenylobacterium deserti]
MGHAQRSTSSADYQQVARPLAVLSDEYPPAFYDPPHAHQRAQLVYASAGVMSVVTDGASFTIPPQRGVWMPAGVRHEAYCRGAVSLRTLYVDPSADARLPTTCRVLKVSSLLRELILEASELPVEYELDGRDGRLMQLILDEVVRSIACPLTALHVPMPQDPRLVRVCRTLMQDPSQEEDLDRWAAVAGMGRRTLTRAFRRETGLSFSVWRQQARLGEALSLLAMGRPVTSVAFDVGYNSPSAFTAMFQRAFGVPPSQYFSA